MQPPQVRLPNQLAYILNGACSVVDGTSKRPPTSFVAHLGTTYASSSNIRTHPIVRDEVEQYVVLYGAPNVRVFSIAGVEQTVNITTAAQTYLDQNAVASPDRLRLYTVADSTFIINTTVAMGQTEQSGTITAATVANPTQLTSTGHGLATGNKIVITESSGITPSLVGSHAITVVDANNFTIPVNVTASASPSASWNRGVPDRTKMPVRMVRTTYGSPSVFDIDVVSWSERTSGNATNNPLPTSIKNGKKCVDMSFFGDRLVLGAGDKVVMGQNNDLFNFFNELSTSVADSDPIELTIGSDEVGDVNYLLPIRRALLVFTKGGRQYEITGSEDIIAVGKTRVQPTTRYKTVDSRPSAMDPLVYFITEDERSARLWEYLYDEVNLPSSAEEVSAHVADLMVLQNPNVASGRAFIRRIVASPQDGVVFILRTAFNAPSYAGSDLFVYFTKYLDGKKSQSAWSRYSIGDAVNIHDLCVIGRDAYMIRGYTLNGSYNTMIEKLPVAPLSSHRVT